MSFKFNARLFSFHFLIEPMQTLITQLQQENERLTAERDCYAANCDRLQAELTDLQLRYETLQQAEAQNRQASLLSTVAQVANLLLRSPDYTTALPDVVRLLGEAVGSDRCVVAQCLIHPDSGAPAVRVGSEWECCQQGVLHSDDFSPHADKLFLWKKDTPFVYEKMRQGEVINALVNDIPDPDRSLFIAQGNSAELFVPISANEELWGFIAFDNCTEPRLYDEAEIAILQVVADSLAAAIERQAKDEELRDSEENLRTLFELSDVGFYLTEIDPPCPVNLPIDQQCDWLYNHIRVVKANAAFAAMYGVNNPDELIGLTNADVHVPNSAKNAAFIRGAVESGYRFRNLETEEIDRQGQFRYFLNSGVGIVKDDQVCKCWATQTDITELREAQRALLQAEQERSQELEQLNVELQQALDRLTESEQRYRTLFELSSEGIVRFGYKQPISLNLPIDEQFDQCYQSIYVAEANDALARMFGRETGVELVGLTLNDFHDRTSEVTQITMRDWIENRYGCQSSETEEFDCHGRKRYILNSAASTIENDCVTSTWVSQVDITELRETQQALLKAEQARSRELEQFNAELQQTLECLQTRERLLETSAIATNHLLTTKDFDQASNAALKLIGESLDTDRATVIEFFEHPSSRLPHWRVLYEWDSPGTMSQISHPEMAQGTHEGMEDLYDQLSRGEAVVQLLNQLPEPFRSGETVLGATQLCEIPIFVEDQLWGLIGFDDCREAKQRSLAELSVLKIAANCIGSAIQQQQTQQALLQSEQARVAELAKANEALRDCKLVCVKGGEMRSNELAHLRQEQSTDGNPS
jgi:GAF domain-containing protein